MNELEQLVERLARILDSRRWGKHRGVVVDNADPDKLGRLKLLVPAAYGEAVSDWALPSLPFAGAPDHGLFFLPEVDDLVWVEFEEGILERPIWTGGFWPGASEMAEFAKRTVATPKGHRIELIDVDDAEAIIVTHCEGAKLSMDVDGITIVDANGNKLVMSADGISVEDTNGNKLVMSSDGISAEDANGNKLATTTDGIALEDSNGNKLTMAASGITLDASKVDIA